MDFSKKKKVPLWPRLPEISWVPFYYEEHEMLVRNTPHGLGSSHCSSKTPTSLPAMDAQDCVSAPSL